MNNQLSDINENIIVADKFVKRTYLNDLCNLEVVPLDEKHKKFNSIRLYRLSKLIFDTNENTNDKLVSVFNAIQNIKSNLVFIIRGKNKTVDFYLGVLSDRDASIADKIFGKSFFGNFPGSVAAKVPQEDIPQILDEATSFGDMPKNLTCLDVIPANRNDNEKDTFIQGIEKFVDTMQGENYTCMIIGSSISDTDCENRMRGYEEIYTTLFPLLNTTLAHGTSEGTSITEGYSESVSKSVTDGISKTMGESTSSTSGFGFSFGAFKVGGNKSFSNSKGTSTSTTESSSTSNTTSTSKNTYEGTTTTTSDNVTITYKNKTVENVLENIDERIKRIKKCMVYGMWECAIYFISEQIQTSVIAANAFRSLMLGDSVTNEKSHLNTFGMRERNSTLNALETLKYCRHPLFRITDLNKEQFVTATEYLNGRELPIMFSLPRKSIAGVTVTSMAEFGRNIVNINDDGSSGQSTSKSIEIGHISHMNKVEARSIKLDLNSLTSHCFICGSTGSGKSNTTFTIIKELLRPEINVPFLVIEPAKGEYKNAFAKVEDINIFTASVQTGRFLKINPFKFNTKIHILEHLDRLIEIFNNCWEMYAAMPAILKDAIEKTYEKKGWDLLNSIYIPGGEPEFPTFKDLLNELPKVINSSGYSSDTKGDYTGALVTRVNSLTNGIAGQVFCDCYDIDDKTLFDSNTIVDLSRVGSLETKSLIMGVLVLKLNEYRMAEIGAVNSPLRHVTILEEAHNLLKNTNNGGGQASAIVRKSVEMLCASIAEMRTFGEGFILVDQSPGAVDIAAIKNTNTKIIMRLPEMTDCQSVGHSVSLDDKQIAELSKLRTGHAVVMQNNWSDAVMAKINYYAMDFSGELAETNISDIHKFKNVVMSSILDEYAIKRTRSMNTILKLINEFDIDFFKKKDAENMVRVLCGRMEKKWDSLFFGNTLMRYAGLDSIFRRAEEKIHEIPKVSDSFDVVKKDSILRLVNYISDELKRTLYYLDDVQRRTMLQYMLFVKANQPSEYNYDLIYKTKYIR